MKKCNYQHLIPGWFVSILFAGCIVGCQIDTSIMTSEIGTPMIAAFATITKTLTLTPIPTQTMIPTRTNTPLPTHTWTPRPTLSQEEAIERVRAVFTGDEICRLPCWGDIIPGETSVEEAMAYFESFAQTVYVNPEDKFIFPEFPNPENLDETIGSTFYVERRTKLVNFINTYRDDYRLDQLLRSYGSPIEIWLQADVDISKRPQVMKYDILLFYPDQSFLAAYRGNGEISPIFDICPSKIDYERAQPVLKLWSPQQEFTFEDVMRKYGADLGGMELYNQIEEVEITGMTAQEFYEIFKYPENADVCIQLPGAEKIVD